MYLNIPSASERFKGERYVIPPRLKQMSRVRVRRTEDYGPVTKLIPTLEEETDGATLIITADDDMVYPHSMVSTLLEAHLREPLAAYGFAGQMIDIDACNDDAAEVRMRGWLHPPFCSPFFLCF